ncbi:CLUMA_CG005192, isoform A [Clunio marinus]|uniref:CLUMA_CG005192, isoform A n=1 Tax=Clunio marinus TaxID=568069 RepID=A0A1J1HU54_9DIPT|nr:CLUMA_CG005192, isoform A [Clunio marinus]
MKIFCLAHAATRSSQSTPTVLHVVNSKTHFFQRDAVTGEWWNELQSKVLRVRRCRRCWCQND